MSVDYERLLRAALANFIAYEGTDALGVAGSQVGLGGLSENENAELTRIRDEVRAQDAAWQFSVNTGCGDE